MAGWLRSLYAKVSKSFFYNLSIATLAIQHKASAHAFAYDWRGTEQRKNIV
jgi:hypothetical protein